jgi:hypothetical protein
MSGSTPVDGTAASRGVLGYVGGNCCKEGENKFLAVASADEKSRNPDGGLVVSGMHLENFRCNPVMLFSHKDDETL